MTVEPTFNQHSFEAGVAGVQLLRKWNELKSPSRIPGRISPKLSRESSHSPLYSIVQFLTGVPGSGMKCYCAKQHRLAFRLKFC
eukprot:3970813-Amphidinium_carterae.1